MGKVAWLAGLSIIAMPASLAAQVDTNRPAMVFFDWGKREIRRDDQEVLDKIAERWRAQPGARLVLSGHSDRSGPGWANLRASKQRAAAVQDYLVEHGVAASAITLQAFGEQQPVVNTEDGVREVQNRRVEISFVAGH
jgi:outer membrane protein OmpA-like peptidoglycan-associated protein